jgi:hypothetical protein
LGEPQGRGQARRSRPDDQDVEIDPLALRHGGNDIRVC